MININHRFTINFVENYRPLKVFDDVVITGLRYFSSDPHVVNLKIQ